jgi:hypothetical protein
MASFKTKQRVERICAKYGVTPIFQAVNNAGGGCYPNKGQIFINLSYNNWFTIQSTLHEISHCINFRQNKYLKYNNGSFLTKDYLKKMALRAEVYADLTAVELGKELGIKYQRVYFFNKKSRKFLKEYYGY